MGSSGRRFSYEEALRVADCVLEMLVVAHAAGVIHRDLKPDNLFLEKSGAVRVLDFGVARMRDDGAIRTETGHVLGTPAYMSPEQARGRAEEIDTRTDLWSLGAIVFTLISGRAVRSGATPHPKPSYSP